MAYCEVCERYFPSDVALAQHNLMSEIHNYDCWRCKRHLESRHALAQHVRDSARHHVCDACDVDFETEDGLEEHKESEHNACRECGRYFDTPSNLFHHRVVHLPKIVECPGCPRTFSTNAAMVLHLEAGTCVTGINQWWVERTALNHDGAPRYTCLDPDFTFMCPTCHTGVRHVSGLLQHIESNFCDEEVYFGSPMWDMLRYMRKCA